MRPILSAMLSVSGTELSDFEKRLLEEANPLGISIFSRNIKDKAQITGLCKEIKETIGRDDVLLAVDQEGGRVCRFIPPDFRSYMSQFSLSSLSDDENKEMQRLHAELIADDLQQIGINWNYAPVLDMAEAGTTASLQSRCFQGGTEKIISYGKIVIDTFKSLGICPCIKHLPCLGRAKVDPHLQLPVISEPLSDLTEDFSPFKELASSSPAGMTAHIVLKAVDNIPITQSKKAIKELIRDYIGFDGFLISDAIDMKALSGSIGEKTRTSLEAGCDAICYCFGKEDELREVVANANFLTDKSLERFEKIRKVISKSYRQTGVEGKAKRYSELASNAVKDDNDYDAVEILHKMQAN